MLDLLEKARVISQQPLERSYHMFYQIMSGAVKTMKGKNDFKLQFTYVCIKCFLNDFF